MNAWDKPNDSENGREQIFLSEEKIELISNDLIKGLYKNKTVQDFLSGKTDSLDISILFKWSILFLEGASRKFDSPSLPEQSLKEIIKEAFIILIELIKEDKEKQFEEIKVQIDTQVEDMLSKVTGKERVRLLGVLHRVSERYLLPYVITLETDGLANSQQDFLDAIVDVDTRQISNLIELIQKLIKLSSSLERVGSTRFPDLSITEVSLADTSTLEKTETIAVPIIPDQDRVGSGLIEDIEEVLERLEKPKEQKSEIPMQLKEMLASGFLDKFENELKIFEIKEVGNFQSSATFAINTVLDRKENGGGREKAYEILKSLFAGVLEIYPDLIVRIASFNLDKKEEVDIEKISEIMLVRAKIIVEKTGVVVKDFIKQADLTNQERFVCLLITVLRSLLKKDNKFTKELNELLGEIEFDTSVQLNQSLLDNIFNPSEEIRMKTFQTLIMSYFFPQINSSSSHILLDVNDGDSESVTYSNFYGLSKVSVENGIPLYGVILKMIADLHSEIGTPRKVISRTFVPLFSRTELDVRVAFANKILRNFQKRYVLLDLNKLRENKK